MEPKDLKKRFLVVFSVCMAVVLVAILAVWMLGTSLKDSDSSQNASSPESTTNQPEAASSQSEGVEDEDPEKNENSTSHALRPEANVNVGPPPTSLGSFTMTGTANITGATYDSMPYELPLNPAGPQATMVRWVDGWGQSPATAEHGTTYVLGHAWGQQRLVFNPISEIVTHHVDFNRPTTVRGESGSMVTRYQTDVLNGDVVTMADAEGNSRRWVIDNAYLVDKYDAIDDAELVDTSIPGRIVLIACSVDGNTDLNYNVIATGHLA